MDCCKYWPGLICCSQLSSVLRDYPNLPSQQRDDIKCLVDKIKVYNRILEVNSLDLDAKTWFDICEIATTSPNLIIKHLVKSNQVSDLFSLDFMTYLWHFAI